MLKKSKLPINKTPREKGEKIKLSFSPGWMNETLRTDCWRVAIKNQAFLIFQFF